MLLPMEFDKGHVQRRHLNRLTLISRIELPIDSLQFSFLFKLNNPEYGLLDHLPILVLLGE